MQVQKRSFVGVKKKAKQEIINTVHLNNFQNSLIQIQYNQILMSKCLNIGI